MKRIALLLLALSLLSCGGEDEDGPTPTPTPATTGDNDIRVTWSANREAAVNRAGGGYRVYHSMTPGFSIDGADSVDVPYVSGASAPATALLADLLDGTHYIVVVAYSSLAGPSGGSGSESEPSTQISITVP